MWASGFALAVVLTDFRSGRFCICRFPVGLKLRFISSGSVAGVFVFLFLVRLTGRTVCDERIGDIGCALVLLGVVMGWR